MRRVRHNILLGHRLAPGGLPKRALGAALISWPQYALTRAGVKAALCSRFGSRSFGIGATALLAPVCRYADIVPPTEVPHGRAESEVDDAGRILHLAARSGRALRTRRGRPRAVARHDRASNVHDVILVNCIRGTLDTRLQRQPCRVASADTALRTSIRNSRRPTSWSIARPPRPNLRGAKGRRRRRSAFADDAHDRPFHQARRYRRHPSLRHILLVGPGRVAVQALLAPRRRRMDGRGPIGKAAVIDFAAIDVSLPLLALYDRLEKPSNARRLRARAGTPARLGNRPPSAASPSTIKSLGFMPTPVVRKACRCPAWRTAPWRRRGARRHGRGLRRVDHEQGPHIAGLGICAGEPCIPASSSDTRKIAWSIYQSTSASVTRSVSSRGFSVTPFRTS